MIAKIKQLEEQLISTILTHQTGYTDKNIAKSIFLMHITHYLMKVQLLFALKIDLLLFLIALNVLNAQNLVQFLILVNRSVVTALIKLL